MTENQAKKTSVDPLVEEMEARAARARSMALAAAAAGLSKKAIAVEVIDVVGKVDYADFLVIMTGTSDRHCGALADAVDRSLSEQGIPPLSSEGRGEWILIDFFDVVVHVFSESARDLYDLSGLWLDASRVPVPDRAPITPGSIEA